MTNYLDSDNKFIKMSDNNSQYKVEKWIPCDNNVYFCKHNVASFMEPCVKCEIEEKKL